ncbi:integrase [Ralstonia solanacearum]|uniref:site-specific integrase n=1 Tax=Ralstonia solanacearum TaxID=305 RepID=UPI0007D79EBA|nr:site-specific integrase [Ralstonia solanacearum]OAI59019.1 integrase [Ralstonia solanacearum]
MTIRTHANVKSLQIFFAYKGVQCRESLRLDPTGPNIKFAEGLRAEIVRRIENGSFRYGDYFPESPRAKLFGHVVTTKTVGDLLRGQLKAHEAAVANGQMSPSTANGYAKIINGKLLPEFESTAAAQLSPSMLREWIGALGVTAKTARNILSVFRSTLDDAVNDELLQRNPLDQIALKKLLSRTTKKSAYVVDPFDTAEKEAIIATAEGQAKNLFQFAFWSGLRTSELIALEWGDIDWIHGRVRVQRAVVVKTEKDTKTEAGTRDVILLPLARAALEAQKPHTFLAEKRVFHNPRTGEPWETDGQIRKTCWAYILKRAGVRYRNPYQTRHTYASTLLSAGENPWWVAGQMGHVDVEMIFRHYGKWIPNSQDGGYRFANDWSQGKAVRQQ